MIKMSGKGYRERVAEFRARNKKKLFGIILILIILSALIAGLLKFQEMAYAIIGLLVLVSVIVMFYGRESVGELFSKKRILIEEMKIIEEKYFKRKIREEDFKKVMKEKQGELIKLDARIDHLLEEEADEDEKEVLQGVAVNKQHYLNELLGEKDVLVREKKIILEKFHKRKIGQEAFQELMAKNERELAGVQARVKAIYSEENIQNTLKEMKGRLGELKQEGARGRAQKIENIVGDLVAKDREERIRQVEYEEAKRLEKLERK